MMSSKGEVVIIGAGVIGCSIAYHLAKQGVPSQIIERDSIASQASGKAWAVILPAAYMLLAEGTLEPRGSLRPGLSLYQEGFERISQLATELKEEGGLDIEYGELPSIRPAFAESEEKYLKERLSEFENEGLIFELESQGFEAGWLGADDMRLRIPYITPEVRGGLLFPSFQVEPYRYTLALAQAAEAMGASIKLAEVIGFRSQGSKVTAVTLATGEVRADVVVLAMGPWSAQGTSWLGKEIPLMVTREQCLRVEVPQPLPPYKVSLGGGVMVVPKVDGSVVLGRVYVHDLVDFDDRPTEEFKTSLLNDAVERVPTLEEARLVEHRAGLEGWAPHGERALPVLGRLPGWDNVYVAMRLGSMGIMLGAPVGRRMADLIVKGSTEEIPKLLSPARFE